MEKQEWSVLADELKKCVNSQGTLHYNYDNALGNCIDKYSPKNGYPFIKDRGYSIRDKEETLGAIDNWVKDQERQEETVIITNAQLELEKDDEAARQEIIPRLIKEKRLLVRAVTRIGELSTFPDENEYRHVQAKALFDVGVRAIEAFQEMPTALVLFPNLTLPDSRVFGGFYGSPWSTFNNRTLKLKFRNINPHFEIRVCTVAERGRRYEDMYRKVGVLFTYTNPW